MLKLHKAGRASSFGCIPPLIYTWGHMRKPSAAKAPPSEGAATKAKASSKVSHRERRCAVILAILLATPLATAQAIAKEQGAGGNEYIKRLIEHLQAYGSLDDPPRKVLPRLYTDEVFEQALDLLGHHTEDITQVQLVKELQFRGVLPAGKHDAKYFFALLKAYCKEHGLEARAGVTRADSFLQEKDFDKRLTYVKVLKKHMEDKGYTESDLVFMDETSVNPSNHPKCKSRCLPAGQMQNSLCLRLAARMAMHPMPIQPAADCLLRALVVRSGDSYTSIPNHNNSGHHALTPTAAMVQP
jgi:hypothetical protein